MINWQDEKAIKELLATKSDSELLAAVNEVLSTENEYIENAADGYRLQWTTLFFTSRGKDGDNQSSYLANRFLEILENHTPLEGNQRG